MIKASLLVFACLFAASATANSTKVEAVTSEFHRAISIIENTQLSIFTDTNPPANHSIKKTLENRIKRIRADLEPGHIDFKATVEEKTIEAMRELLAETLDSYNDQFANYITPGQLNRYYERRTGKYFGVGLKFRTFTKDYPLVIGKIDGGPLQNSDIAPGDKIIEVDGYSLKGKSQKEVTGRLKGAEGTHVTLSIRRYNSEFEVQAKRAEVKLQYAASKMLPDKIGYLKISRFGGHTHKLVEKLLRGLITRQARGIVLDLRDNPGGSTLAARAIVSMFSRQDSVYCEKYKSGTLRTLPRYGEHLTDLPLAVLINGDSMSSSEIVAGALQDHKRGLIVGSPSYGKGLVQKVHKLSDPLGGAVRTTIAVFGTPDHRPIHGAGIVPDIYIETPADFMFRRSGSLNISAEAQTFQRKLLEEKIKIQRPQQARDLINATDRQLERAIEEVALLSGSFNN